MKLFSNILLCVERSKGEKKQRNTCLTVIKILYEFCIVRRNIKRGCTDLYGFNGQIKQNSF